MPGRTDAMILRKQAHFHKNRNRFHQSKSYAALFNRSAGIPQDPVRRVCVAHV
jgi:hypothetical protein